MNTTFCECNSCGTVNKIAATKALAQTPVCGKCGAELRLHALVSEVSGKGLKKILNNSNQPVVVDFWASWCGPCRIYTPEFEKASKEASNITFLKVNTEIEQDLSAQLGIRGIPCTILFKNGVEIRRQSGVMNSAQIQQFISG
jgi:thioredoxin 2